MHAERARIKNAYIVLPTHFGNLCAECLQCWPTLMRKQIPCMPGKPGSGMHALCCTSAPNPYYVDNHWYTTCTLNSTMTADADAQAKPCMPGRLESRMHTMCCPPSVLSCAPSSYNVSVHWCANYSHAPQASPNPKCIHCVAHLLC